MNFQCASKFSHPFTHPGKANSSQSALLWDAAGNLYGITTNGPTETDCAGEGCGTVFIPDGQSQRGGYSAGLVGHGTVFKITPAGKETVLVNFDGTNGRLPQSALVQDSGGNFYGTTSFGPDTAGCSELGCGTVYTLTPAGVESIHFAFPDNEQDGEHPLGVVLDAAGNLYWTAAATMGNQYPGNVFEIAP